jgi:hypothetical protein
MSQRTSIMTTLVNHVATSTSSAGFRGMKFLHEVNSFPAFYIHPQNESRVHEGDGGAYAVCAISLRGYQYSDQLDAIEQFMRDLEVAVQSYAPAYASLVDEARVVSVRTDEGTMAPYGIVDMQLEVLYSVDYSVSSRPVRADSTIITADSTKYSADRG